MTQPVARRDFLALTGLTLAGAATGSLPVMAGPFAPADFHGPAPADKRLRPEWLRSLTERTGPSVYRGKDLDWIGMPVGGIGAGQLYLGGHGQLWLWDIFNIPRGTGDGNYAHPPAPSSPLLQQFTLTVRHDGKTDTRSIGAAVGSEASATAFPDIAFLGQYPIGGVTFRDPALPVHVELEAFSPFIPLNADDSSLPATVMRFTVRNTSRQPIEVELSGLLENAVLLHSQAPGAIRRSRITQAPGATCLVHSAERDPAPAPPVRPEIVFEDWSRGTYDGWTIEGTAFGTAPLLRSRTPAYQGDLGGPGDYVVNSHATAPGASVEAKDSATGRLTSRTFTIDRSYLRFWIGGGSHPGKTCLNLVIDNRVVRSETGRNDNRMAQRSFDLRDLQGKEARLEIVDAETGPWGNIGVGSIVLSDAPAVVGKLEDLPDFGTMTLALLGAPAEIASADVSGEPTTAAFRPTSEKLVGSLGCHATLPGGAATTITFVIGWHFPNLEIGGLGRVGRWYAPRFSSAEAVARYVAERFNRLYGDTKRWRDTWYDSTLPHWFLDRTLLTVSTLATSACYRFADGRFYAWEGVGCCAGTCTHVWHYAHAMARLFPELERDTRERVDFGIGFDERTGVTGFRAEFDRGLAVDGQAGTLLRAYREHQMSPDNGFLTRNWPRIKKAFDPLLALDPDGDGVLEGPQMNTLDQPWYGKVAWLSSLYAAALRAGEAMATEMGEPEFARRCREIAERGARSIDAELFNGEYYQQVRDPNRPKTAGSYDGCEIDQVFGDGWARQVGLPAILPQKHVKTALGSLWKYNFLPDVGPFRAAHRAGRIYALAGEAGLVMCSWPRGEAARVAEGFDFYFNECMTGFEYQAASHMVYEGLVPEGLAITRAIHDRYHPSRRNPWNEVECGDHYARAMAGYGVYLAAQGFEAHGPKGHLGFSPRIAGPEFKAAFTTAEGWGTFHQVARSGVTRATLTTQYGHVRLTTLALGSSAGLAAPTKVRVARNGRKILALLAVELGRQKLTFDPPITLEHGQSLAITLS